MNDWYIDQNGCHWRRCKLIARRLLYVVVETYDGETISAVERNGRYYQK